MNEITFVMTSSKVFSFYDAASVAQEAAKSPINTEDASPAYFAEESVVEDVRDEADVIADSDDEARANVATPTDPHITPISDDSGTVNQWLDRANALNEIRMLLKEEIEQDSGEYPTLLRHIRTLF